MKIALIGMGRMGQQHLDALRSEPQVEWVAICDPTLSGSKDGLPVRDYKSILWDCQVDAVLIAAPTHLHEPLVIQALEAGKHVLCEKPLTLNTAQDLKLGTLAKQYGLRLHVGYWRRFATPYRAFRTHLRASRIGPLSALRLAQWDAVAPPLSFCDPNVSGGIEVDCGVHELDLITWLTGSKLSRLCALSAKPSERFAPLDDVETLHALLQTDDQHLASIDLTRTAGGWDSLRSEAIGQMGSLTLEITDSAHLTLRRADGTVLRQVFDSSVIPEALREQFRDFSASIRTGKPSVDSVTALHSADALAAGRALRFSRLQGGIWQTLSRQKNRTANPC